MPPTFSNQGDWICRTKLCGGPIQNIRHFCHPLYVRSAREIVPMLIVEFTNGVAKTDNLAIPGNGTPCLYFLSQKGKRPPFYIGEYGKSKTYSVVVRIARHFSASGTLRRVAENMPKFKNKVPRSVMAHIFVLDSEFNDEEKRKSLEAWVIYKTCHVQKIQDKRFAVVKYAAPNHDYSKMAARILSRYKKRS